MNLRRKHSTLGAPDRTVRAARRLRKDMSLPEVLLWREMRKRPGGHKFRRQHPLSGIVLDFVCLERRLAIEIDGFAHDCGDRPERDQRRDAFLRSRGYSVLRLPARLVLDDLNGAVEAVLAACDSARPLHHASHGPPPRSGEDLRKLP